MSKFLRVSLPFGLLLVFWLWASSWFGAVLAPPPWHVGAVFGRMLLQADTWWQVGATVWRGLAGLILAVACAYLVGIPCGLHRHLMDFFSPLVTVMQGLPPIVWISLLLVWARVGALVPVIVVFASVFPVLFIAIAQGAAGLDRRLFRMAKIYRVPRRRILLDLILPGLARPVLSAFSFALGITWKVAATAEFFGAPDGIGARIYRSFRLLDMPALFAWTVIIALIGLALDTGVISRVRVWAVRH